MMIELLAAAFLLGGVVFGELGRVTINVVSKYSKEK